MAMQETVGSMRAYLTLVGGVGLILNLAALGSAGSELDAITISACGVSIVLAVGYLICALRLRTMLIRSPGTIKALLISSLAVQGIIGTMVLLADQNTKGLVTPVLSILICMYLLANVNRLSRELQAAEPLDLSETGN